MANKYHLTLCWTREMPDAKLRLVGDTVARWMGGEPPAVDERQRAAFAWCGGQLVGIALLRATDVLGVHAVESLCVEPDFRGEGVGTFVLRGLAKIGVRTVMRVAHGADHDALVRWCAARGYERVSRARVLTFDAQNETLLASGAVDTGEL